MRIAEDFGVVELEYNLENSKLKMANATCNGDTRFSQNEIIMIKSTPR